MRGLGSGMLNSWGAALRLAAVAALPLVLLLALAACEEQQAGAGPTAVAESAPTVEAAPEPTATPVPEPTPTATPEPEPTPTAAPEAVSTPAMSAEMEAAMQAVMAGPCGDIIAFAESHPEVFGEGGVMGEQAVAELRALAERTAADPQLAPLSAFLTAVAAANGDVAAVPEDVATAAAATLMETCNFGALMNAFLPEVEKMLGELGASGPLAQACIRLAFVGLQAPREAFTDEAKWQEYSSYRALIGTPLGEQPVDQFWQELSAVYELWSASGGSAELGGLLVEAYATRSFDGYQAILEASETACEEAFAGMEGLDDVADGLEDDLAGFAEGLEDAGISTEEASDVAASFLDPLFAKVATGQFASPAEEGCLRVTAAIMAMPDELFGESEQDLAARALVFGGNIRLLTADEFWAEMERGRAALTGQPGADALVAALADAIAAGDLETPRVNAINVSLTPFCGQYIAPLMAP